MTVRRYSRRKGGASVRNYSGSRFVSDTISIVIPAPAGPNVTVFSVVVAQMNNQGVRHVKNFDLQAMHDPAPQTTGTYALLYIPEGIADAQIQLTLNPAPALASLYIPEQHIILSGISSSLGTVHQFSSRNVSLSSNDKVVIAWRPDGGAAAFHVRISFWISFG
jgi:hypothetical protein